MIAGDAGDLGDLSMARTRPWFAPNRHDIIRGLAPILGLAIAWSISTAMPPYSVLVGLMVYAFVHLGLITVRRGAGRMAASTTRKTIEVYKCSEPVPIPNDMRSRLMKALESKIASKKSC